MAARPRLLASCAVAVLLATWTLDAASQEAAASPPSTCPLQPQYPLPRASAELRELADRLDPLATRPGCLGDAFFHAWRGAVLLAAGEPATAIESLERALLLRPDLAAAEVDLALAFAQVGQPAASRAILEELAQRPDLPTALRESLRVRQAVADSRASSGWQRRLQFSLLAGGDTNLNNGPAVSELTLTFPQGDLTLPLATESLPRGGGAVLASAQGQAVRSSGASLWVVHGEARARQTARGETNYAQLDAGASWLQAPQAPRQWVARVNGSWLHFAGRYLLRTTRGSLLHQWPGWSLSGRTCRPGGGPELEDRHFPATRELDGLYRGITLSVICTEMQGAGQRLGSGHVQLRTGRDKPSDAQRPGGEQRRTELRAQWDWPVASPWQGVVGPGTVSVAGTFTRQSDTTGYSAVLENNAVRRTSRAAFQADAAFSLGGGLFAVATAEASQQRSNLRVFTGRQRSIYLGLRWEVM